MNLPLHSQPGRGAEALRSDFEALSFTAPSGREGPVLSQEQIISEATSRLNQLFPDMSRLEMGKMVRAVRWAVAKEAETNNTIIRNSCPSEMRLSIDSRLRPEHFGIDGENIFRALVVDLSKPQKNTSNDYVRSPEELAEKGIERILEGKVLLSPAEISSVKAVLLWAIAAETETNNRLLHNSSDREIRNALISRVRPHLVVMQIDGSPLTQRLQTPYWTEWYPGLDIDHMTLKEVYDTLPGFPASKVPEPVRRYENPESPEALPGAVSLLRHDFLHILLGRGLLDQDEAFVIGFTMGTAREALTTAHVERMKSIFDKEYPEPYRITEEDLIAFELGVKAGRELGIKDLYKVPIEEMGHLTIGEARKLFGLDKERLREYFREESRLIPNTLETARLPL